jgi:hypothetical protein
MVCESGKGDGKKDLVVVVLGDCSDRKLSFILYVHGLIMPLPASCASMERHERWVTIHEVTSRLMSDPQAGMYLSEPTQSRDETWIRVHSTGKAKWSKSGTPWKKHVEMCGGAASSFELEANGNGTTERYLLLYMHRLSAHRKLMTRFSRGLSIIHPLCAPVLHRPFASDRLLPSQHVSHVERPNTQTEPFVRTMQTLQEGLRWLRIESPLLLYTHSRPSLTPMLLLYQDVKMLQPQRILGGSLAHKSIAHSEDAFRVIC